MTIGDQPLTLVGGELIHLSDTGATLQARLHRVMRLRASAMLAAGQPIAAHYRERMRRFWPCEPCPSRCS